MPFICSAPELYVGKKVGSGQCVAFVKECTNAPPSSLWKRSVKVKGNETIQKGTAIATFDSSGIYPNNATGNHAAIYAGQNVDGIWVYDQWVKQGSVQKRLIRFRGGNGSPSNDGDTFYVIE